MDLPSRYSMDPVAFHKADEQIAADERRDRQDEEGQPRISYFRINWPTPYLDKLHRALCGEGKPK